MLADQGVSILTGAQVTEMRKARAGSSGGLSSGGSNGASSSSSVGIGGAGTAVGPDLAKRLVYVKDRTGQQEVRWKQGGVERMVCRACCWPASLPARWFRTRAVAQLACALPPPSHSPSLPCTSPVCASACATGPLCHHATVQVLEADMVLWSAGQAPATKAAAQPPPGALKLPFSTNSRGAMQTDATLRVLHHSRVFALGDVAVRCALRLPEGCSV